MNQNITAQDITYGKAILPIERIKLMSPDDWENLIEEWLETTGKYTLKNIEKHGGSGDMGVDVAAYITDPKKNPKNYEWDCYQCKRYAEPLSPSNMWVEFGKIIYFSYSEEYPIPKHYYLIGTHGVGTKLKQYLQDSNKLKTELKKQWDTKCKNEITESTPILLEGDFLKYFDHFNFNIFDKIEPKIIVDEHSKHKNHLVRFGGVLPNRKSISIPEVEKDKELRYVKQLIKAYNSDSVDSIDNIQDILGTKYDRHFNDTRKSFYKAEELRILTRDNLPDEIFDNLKGEIFDGVVNIVEETHNNGFQKTKAVENKAIDIKLESNPLRETCQTIDKKGLCHHLVNDEKISWVEEDE